MPASSNITLGVVGLTARLVGWSDHTVLAPETAVKTTYRLGESDEERTAGRSRLQLKEEQPPPLSTHLQKTSPNMNRRRPLNAGGHSRRTQTVCSAQKHFWVFVETSG